MLAAVPFKDKIAIRTRDNHPLRLTNENFLRLNLSLEQHRDRHPAVLTSSYQYQTDGSDDPQHNDWVFRYDFIRFPEDHHPPAHLHVNGNLNVGGVLDVKQPLERVHFATGRVSLEAVLRVLTEQFHVQSVQPAPVWRAVLDLSERGFQEIMHSPPSGPPR